MCFGWITSRMGGMEDDMDDDRFLLGMDLLVHTFWYLFVLETSVHGEDVARGVHGLNTFDD